MAPDSPFILHEIGVIAFQSQELVDFRAARSVAVLS